MVLDRRKKVQFIATHARDSTVGSSAKRFVSRINSIKSNQPDQYTVSNAINTNDHELCAVQTPSKAKRDWTLPTGCTYTPLPVQHIIVVISPLIVTRSSLASSIFHSRIIFSRQTRGTRAYSFTDQDHEAAEIIAMLREGVCCSCACSGAAPRTVFEHNVRVDARSFSLRPIDLSYK